MSYSLGLINSVPGAICFLSVLQPSLQSLSETTASFEGRGVLAKHQGMKMLHPAIVVL